MIQTYSSGVPYSDFVALYPNHHLLARIKTIAAVLEMALTLGRVNVDCHDGNVLYCLEDRDEPDATNVASQRGNQPDPASVRVAFVDNGMTLTFSQQERSMLGTIAVAFIKLEATQFIHVLMHFINPSDIDKVTITSLYEQIDTIFSAQEILPDLGMMKRLIAVLKSYMHVLDYRLLCFAHQLVQFDQTIQVDKDKACSFSESLSLSTTNIYSLTFLYIYL